MSVETVPDITLDLRGLRNPAAILKMAEAAGDWQTGDIVRVMAGDECFANDFLRWSIGCELDFVSFRYLPSGETELMLRMPHGAHRRRS